MRLNRLAALLTALCIILGGCTIKNETGFGEASYDDFRVYIDEQRERSFGVTDLAPLADRYRCPTDFEVRDETELRFELSRTTVQKASVAKITRSEAISDVDSLMKMLREDYGAYEFFGGSAAFEAMRARLVDDISAACAQGSGILSVIDFTKLVSDALGSTVSDRSFLVRDKSVTPADKLYHVKDEYFTREGDHFCYHGVEVVSIDGNDPHDYIKPTVSPNGAIVYSLWQTFPANVDPTALFLVVKLSDGETVNLRWTSAFIDSFSNYSYETSFRVGSTTAPDGSISLPVVASAMLSAAGDDFVATANRPADEKVLILDLRVSRGSDDRYIRRWLETYAGAAPELNELRMHRPSPINNAILGESEVLESELNGANVNVSSDRTLIVLVGGNTGAGETAQQLASRVSNVITIGGISGGAALTTDPVVRYLPISNVRITFGTTLRLSQGMFDENGGVTLSPDLYANPADAMVFARNMVGYYGLLG